MQPNQQNPKYLDYTSAVREQIGILDEIFLDLGVPRIFENPDITLDENWVFRHYLKFNLRRPKSNSVQLDFHLSQGMQIDFQRYPEAFEFSEDDVLNNQARIKEVLLPLLSSPILVEYKGSVQYVNLFNRNGSGFAIWSLGSTVSLIAKGYWKAQSIDQHLFEPIYSVH